MFGRDFRVLVMLTMPQEPLVAAREHAGCCTDEGSLHAAVDRLGRPFWPGGSTGAVSYAADWCRRYQPHSVLQDARYNGVQGYQHSLGWFAQRLKSRFQFEPYVYDCLLLQQPR